MEKEAFESQFTSHFDKKVRFVDTNKEIIISDDSGNLCSDFSDNEVEYDNSDSNFAGWVDFDKSKHTRKYCL